MTLWSMSSLHKYQHKGYKSERLDIGENGVILLKWLNPLTDSTLNEESLIIIVPGLNASSEIPYVTNTAVEFGLKGY